jgi:hypothetical protein
MAATITVTDATTATATKADAKVDVKVAAEREKALKILAKSIFKELKSQGYETKQIVGLATELLSQVTDDLHTDTAR